MFGSAMKARYDIAQEEILRLRDELDRRTKAYNSMTHSVRRVNEQLVAAINTGDELATAVEHLTGERDLLQRTVDSLTEAARQQTATAPWIRYSNGEIEYEEAVRLGGKLAGPVPDDLDISTKAAQDNDISVTIIGVVDSSTWAAHVPMHIRYEIADALWDAGYRKELKPITAEVVEAAKLAYQSAQDANPYGFEVRMRAALEAAEEARSKQGE